MSVPYNGGPAFPRPASVSPRVADIKQQDGMSLRDWFAGQAMHAFLRNLPPHDVDEPYSTWAGDAYEMADAMLKAREA
jgi:hypothetical protein